MKQQVARFSPHQNAKVIAVLMAVTSLIFFVPFFLLASLFGAGQAMPIWAAIIVPLIYLVIGYIGVVIGCALYNVLVPFTGGIEYESTAGGLA
jgi:hypothetical protein